MVVWWVVGMVEMKVALMVVWWVDWKALKMVELLVVRMDVH